MGGRVSSDETPGIAQEIKEGSPCDSDSTRWDKSGGLYLCCCRQCTTFSSPFLREKSHRSGSIKQRDKSKNDVVSGRTGSNAA